MSWIWNDWPLRSRPHSAYFCRTCCWSFSGGFQHRPQAWLSKLSTAESNLLTLKSAEAWMRSPLDAELLSFSQFDIGSLSDITWGSDVVNAAWYPATVGLLHDRCQKSGSFVQRCLRHHLRCTVVDGETSPVETWVVKVRCSEPFTLHGIPRDWWKQM